MSRIASAALVLALTAPLAPAVQAQQFPPGVDPNLLMAMDQMISYAYMGCQMGDQMSCYNAQNMQQYATAIVAAGQYCMQTGEPQSCGFYQQGAMNVQMAYGNMMQMSQGQMATTPGYDPNNPLGATQQQRLDSIAQQGSAIVAQGQARLDGYLAQSQSFINQIGQ
jgi:hypothetical protein